ncbi:MAG: hypothetical protein WCP19_13090, partial [Chloroflexota bacterium]
FWAGLLGFAAAWTRAHGGLLFIPLVFAVLRQFNWRDIKNSLTISRVIQAVWSLLPLAGYLMWRFSHLGEGWAALQSFYFGRGVFSIFESIASWKQAFVYAGTVESGMVYFIIEAGSVLLALTASLFLLRKDPEVALFSLAIIMFSAVSGSAQSEARYMLTAPAMFIFLALLGRNKTFDRAWTLLSILLLGMSLMLFSFDMWVG